MSILGKRDKRHNFEDKLTQIKKSIQSGSTFDYELILSTLYSKWVTPGETVIDIGAHTGKHLRNLINLVGDNGYVIAFEPLPFAFNILTNEYSRPNVSLHNVALSDRNGTSEFIFAQGTPEESGLKQRIFNREDLANPSKIQVKVVRLDDYTNAIKKLSYIKIDIEGGEIDCLKGSVTTLSKHRPLISVEYGYPGYNCYGHNKDTLFDFSKGHDYVLYDLFLNSLEDKKDWHSACDSIYWDFFMVPGEKQEEFLNKLSN